MCYVLLDAGLSTSGSACGGKDVKMLCCLVLDNGM
jgi:hypothetical protein